MMHISTKNCRRFGYARIGEQNFSRCLGATREGGGCRADAVNRGKTKSWAPSQVGGQRPLALNKDDRSGGGIGG